MKDEQKDIRERVTKLDAKIDELAKKSDAKAQELAASFRARRDQAKAKLAKGESLGALARSRRQMTSESADLRTHTSAHTGRRNPSARSCVLPGMRALLFALVPTLWASTAFAQYNKQAGKSKVEAEDSAPAPAPTAPMTSAPDRGGNGTSKSVDKDTTDPKMRSKPQQIARDTYGNAQGATYDLAVDGAFDGQTIVIIDYYSFQYSQDFSGPKNAVKEKGFSMLRYNQAPSLTEFSHLLEKANQFWLISSCDNTVHLSPEHQKLVKLFFEEGRGVYLWGDNDPCNADADALAKMLVDARVTGDLPGDQTVKISAGSGKPGMVKDHLLSTGVETVYEGITVATVKPAGAMTPVIWGSAGNLVAAAYEKNGRRLIVDGGFTRLSYKWDTAGTGRYIKNAAAWLANWEKFGDQVLATDLRKKKPQAQVAPNQQQQPKQPKKPDDGRWY